MTSWPLLRAWLSSSPAIVASAGYRLPCHIWVGPVRASGAVPVAFSFPRRVVVAVNPKIVNVSLTPLPRFNWRLAIVVNRSPRWISGWLRRKGNDGVFVLPLFSCAPQKVPSFRRYKKDHVVMPYYIGGLVSMRDAADLIVNNVITSFTTRDDTVEIVLDERNDL